MTCEICLELLSRLLDEDLSPEEVLAVDDHMQHCGHCREVYHDLREVQHAMNDLPDPALPVEAHNGAMAVIRRIASSRKKNRIIAWGGMAAAVVLCAVGIPALVYGSANGKASDQLWNTATGGDAYARSEAAPMATAAPAAAPMEEAPMAAAMDMGFSSNETAIYGAIEEAGLGLPGAIPQSNDGEALYGIKIERSFHLSAESKDFTADVARVDALLASAEGYYEYRDISGMPYTEPGGYGRNASMNMRVPVEHLDAFVGELRLTGRATSYSEYANDLTSQYYDTQGRLEAYQAELKKYQELLNRAEVIEDIIKIHDAMTNLQYQIDSLTGQIKGMDSRVSYATVSLYLREVESDTIRPVNPGLGERIQSGFFEAVNRLVDFLAGVLVAILALSPLWLPIVILAAAAFFIVRAIVRKRRKGMIV